MIELFTKVKIQQKQQLPFVLFSKPNSDKLIGLFQKNDHLYFLKDYQEKGFIFSPFDSEQVPIIPLEHSEIIVESISKNTYFIENNTIEANRNFGKDFFEDIVSKAINSIENNEFDKVVVSRKEEVLLTEFDLEFIIKKMMFAYPSAFSYCFFHPKIGLWMGATPELLVKSKDNFIQTVALAGTQLVDKNSKPKWEIKEKTEQQLVIDFIIEGLKPWIKDLTISAPYDVKAGNLWHIKTDISANLKNKNALKKVIDALHPTSAVCGLPKEEAKNFILSNEGYKREFYSGYLGELNIDFLSFKTNQSELYVNLRCMKIVDNKAFLYIGCGITKDSIASHEYIETVYKAMTMKKILF